MPVKAAPWALAACVACIAVAACSGTSTPLTPDNTTTTYGGTSSDGSTSDGGDPVEVTTDDGSPSSSTDEPDPDPDPSDSDDPFHCFDDFGWIPDVGVPPGLRDGSPCTADAECSSGNCYVIPLLGGYCGECNEDADCSGGGCTPPNAFEGTASFCNMGEPAAGCQSDVVCSGDLQCGTTFDMLGLVQITTCGECLVDADCGGDLCVPFVDLPNYTGQNVCMAPNSLPQGSYCHLDGNGNESCASGICSVVDVMGLAEIGVCGQCNGDLDCEGGVCVEGELVLGNGELVGSTCQ